MGQTVNEDFIRAHTRRGRPNESQAIILGIDHEATIEDG